MSTSRELLAFVLEEKEGVAEHLDDTLLNRLEQALYCEDEHHAVWSNFHDVTFRKLMTSFEDNLGDTELSRGKLKIKFAIFWRMRNYCQPSDFEVVTRILSSLIMSKNCSMISILHTFYQKSLHEANLFHFSGELFDSHLMTLRNLHRKSVNVNHRRSIILLFILLSLSGFKNRKGGDRFPNCIKSTDLSSYDVDFLVDLLTVLIKVPRPSNVYLNDCTKNIAKFLNKNSVVVDHKEELVYLSTLLAPYQPAILEDAMNDSHLLSKVGGYLRRLLTNEVFQDCPLHRFLVSSWYSQMEDLFNESKTYPPNKVLTPLSTCQKNPLLHSAFRDLLPPTFIDNLWNYSINLLLQNQFDNVFKNCWLLFNRYCHLQEDARKREQLQFLLAQICNRPHILAEFSVLMDSVFSLYSNLPSITRTEGLGIFQQIYRLAHEECSRLKSSGGCLSYSFLLLRIYQSPFLNEAVASQLLKLQKLVSEQIAEEPSLVANETIIEMLRGFFITPLLEPQVCDIFSPQIFAQILDLVTSLQIEKASIGAEQIFPSTLKAVLLACLLRCLNCQAVVEHLRTTETFLLTMETCADLGSAEWEEDPFIRRRIVECWDIFSKNAEEQQNLPEKRNLLERLRPHFSLRAPVQIDHSVCPSCGECIHSLLEDIVLSSQTVGDLDCVGD
uniref:Uncharacterized protein n=1 Tax=Echinococcus granulosus TaxID=6210 RepID=A0A068W6U7_ECHGR|nr:hypothetical protein EgrG_000752200 [Echinococcus granulosus]